MVFNGNTVRMTAVCEAAFLCDEVRQEASGKLIAIGIYSVDLVFQRLPSVANFTLMALIRTNQSGPQPIQIRLMLGEHQLASMSGEFSGREGSPTWVPIPLPTINFESAELMCAEVRLSSEEWQRFFELPVREREPTPAS